MTYWEVTYMGRHLPRIALDTIRLPLEFDQGEAERLRALGYTVEPDIAEVHSCGDGCEVSHLMVVRTFVKITRPKQ